MPIITGFTTITCFFLIILYIFKTKILNLLNQERKLRNSLHKANISKTKLIRATSHDLKNYVFGIKKGEENHSRKTQFMESNKTILVHSVF